MTPERIRALLEAVAQGQIDTDAACAQLAHLPFEELGFARIDHHRTLRQGFPEVIFCEGKTVDQVVAIAERILSSGTALLATRTNADMREALVAHHPAAHVNALARTVVVPGAIPNAETIGEILIVAAGTSDLPVAEEAVETARIMGNAVETLYDVGVAGIHRLLACRDRLLDARGHRGGGWYGRGVAQRGGGPGRRADHRRADQRGLWGEFQRVGRAVGHAKQLRGRCDRGQHRQRLWRRCRSEQNQPPPHGAMIY